MRFIVQPPALYFRLGNARVAPQNSWLRGEHCQAVHEAVIGGSRLDLEQVQADEIKVKTQGGVLWMAQSGHPGHC